MNAYLETDVVYGLFDPRSRKVRYVGLTQSNIGGRLTSHIQDGNAFARGKKAHCRRKAEWIAELRSLGMKPLLVVLENGTDLADLEAKERKWHDRYLALGHELTNDPNRLYRRKFILP